MTTGEEESGSFKDVSGNSSGSSAESSAESSLGTVLRISSRAADRLRLGHLWVYRTELGGGASGEVDAPAPGALVRVEDGAGRPLGAALYSSSSQIALRMVAREAGLSRAAYLAEVRLRVAQALARRRAVAPLDNKRDTKPDTDLGQVSDAQRLVFSEADGLPGIVVDRYADLVILQLLTQGTAKEDVRTAVVAALVAALAPAGEALTIVERPDPRIRELEQLAPPPEGAVFTNRVGPAHREAAQTGAAQAETAQTGAEAKGTETEETQAALLSTVFTVNGLRFEYDAAAGQKTGAFLDQRLNYAAAAAWVRRSGRTGHALDVCTYQGGFALHLAEVCERVTGVDQSRTALQVADRNLTRNPQLRAEVDWVEADAFAFLRALAEARRQAEDAPNGVARHGPAAGRHGHPQQGLPGGLPLRFDAVVLDPPAFAKSKRAVEGALRGYKELNLRAMQLLAPGGTLVTCSCSHHVSLEAFTTTVAEAAADAGRWVQLLEVRAAAPDHPEVLALPETRYLKCLIFRVE